MKQRPILFKAEMVRAILGGKKTQTRRVVTERNYPIAFSGFTDEVVMSPKNHLYQSPYGTVGDQLWVRETFWYDDENDVYIYKADQSDECKLLEINRYESGLAKFNWKPSIFMPRAASRIYLEITDIQIERLNDISESDALSEGCQVDCGEGMSPRWFEGCKMTDNAIEAYQYLWESINGIGSWAKNPFVWCVSFKVIKP